MSKFQDLTGNTYGRLSVVSHSHTRRWETSKQTDQYWVCLCDCGESTVVRGSSLKSGYTKSCGCLRREVLASKELRKPRNNAGLSHTPEYALWSSAKERAAKYGREFSIEVLDIVIPEVCPILGIPLVKGKAKLTANSPSLDRRDSSRGYTKDNVAVISHRANSLKQDSSIAILERLIAYMKGEEN